MYENHEKLIQGNKENGKIEIRKITCRYQIITIQILSFFSHFSKLI